MVQTVKFSQFVAGGVLTSNGRPVGLENGNNTIWSFSGGTGGSGGVTQTITQNGHGLSVRNWVKIDTSGLYIRAQGNTADADDVIGVVISVAADGNSFVLQQSGYITTAQNVFVGLVPGDNYFLDTAVAGNMVNVDVTGDGEVSRPVFAADTPTSGWVLPYRGIIADGGPDTGSGGGGGGPDSSIRTISQTLHGFIAGDIVRPKAPIGVNPVKTIEYVKGLGDSLEHSQTTGMVIEVINPNQFKIQFSGYNDTGGTNGSGALTVDYLGNPIVGGVTYYLSPTTPGKVTSTDPITVGFYSKPVYTAEQAFAETGTDGGWILDQRPLAAPVNPTPVPPGDITTVPFTGTYITTTTGWETVFCATITPTSATHRVWVVCDVAAGASGSGNPIYFRIIRNGVPIGVGDAAGSRLQCTGAVMHHFNGNPTNAFINYIDSPGSVTQVIYCLQIISPGGLPGYVNRTSVDSNVGTFGRSTSTLTLIEVQP